MISQDHYEAYLRYELWKTNLNKLKNIRELNQKKYEQEKKLPKSMTTAAKLRELESEYLIAGNNYDETNLTFQHEIEAEIITLETSLKINENKLKQIKDSLLFTEVRAPIDGTIQNFQALTKMTGFNLEKNFLTLFLMKKSKLKLNFLFQQNKPEK